MTLSKFFENRDFLWDKDIVKWRIRSRGLGWPVTWILLKGKGLNQKLKNLVMENSIRLLLAKLLFDLQQGSSFAETFLSKIFFANFSTKLSNRVIKKMVVESNFKQHNYFCHCLSGNTLFESLILALDIKRVTCNSPTFKPFAVNSRTLKNRVCKKV